MSASIARCLALFLRSLAPISRISARLPRSCALLRDAGQYRLLQAGGTDSRLQAHCAPLSAVSTYASIRYQKSKTTPVACSVAASGASSVNLVRACKLRCLCGNCWRCLLRNGSPRFGIDADELALPPLVLKLHDAVNEREQR